jgi:hypothetical protein
LSGITPFSQTVEQKITQYPAKRINLADFTAAPLFVGKIHTHSNAGVSHGKIARQATVFYAACMSLF